MGVRLYNPATGRFLTVDPVRGGNPNAYTYPVDPINMFDLDGRWGFKKVFKAAASAGRFVARHRSTIALAASFVPGGQAFGAGMLAYRAYRARRLWNKLEFTRSAYHAGRQYQNSRLLLGQVLRGGRYMRDPGGARGAVKFVAKGTYNGRAYNHHVVVHPRSRSIYHWHMQR